MPDLESPEFRRAVEQIVHEVLSSRDLTVREAQAITSAVKDSINLLITREQTKQHERCVTQFVELTMLSAKIDEHIRSKITFLATLLGILQVVFVVAAFLVSRFIG